MSVETFRLLIMMGFPVICFNMLHYINACMGPLSRTLDCIEYFSGVANIARAFRHNRGTAAEYDYIRSAEHENLCKPSGWMTAFVLAMKLQERGLASWATVCSSWIFMSKSCTGRSRADPWGAPPGPGITESTEKGNTMVARMICVLMLLQARKCTWLLEQPESSVMEYIPQFSCLRMRVQRVRTVMGAFGHDSRKGTILLSCHDWHKALEREVPPGFTPKKMMTKRFIDKNGLIDAPASLESSNKAKHTPLSTVELSLGHTSNGCSATTLSFYPRTSRAPRTPRPRSHTAVLKTLTPILAFLLPSFSGMLDRDLKQRRGRLFGWMNHSRCACRRRRRRVNKRRGRGMRVTNSASCGVAG